MISWALFFKSEESEDQEVKELVQSQTVNKWQSKSFNLSLWFQIPHFQNIIMDSLYIHNETAISEYDLADSRISGH